MHSLTIQAIHYELMNSPKYRKALLLILLKTVKTLLLELELLVRANP